MNFRIDFSLSLFCFHSSVLVEVGGTGAVWWHEEAGGQFVRLGSLSTMWIPPSLSQRPDLGPQGMEARPLPTESSHQPRIFQYLWKLWLVFCRSLWGVWCYPNKQTNKKLIFLRSLWYLILALPIHEHGMLPRFVFFRWLAVSLASIVNLFLTIFLCLFGMMTCSRFNNYLLA